MTADIAATNAGYLAYDGEKSPDYTDYKIAVAKSFSLAGSEGWVADVAYAVSSTNLTRPTTYDV